MKISELIPSKLPGIALRTLQGEMTGEDHDYLKEHCNIDVLESWFCDDKSLELEVKLEDGTITMVDLGDVEGLASDLDNYQEIVYYSLLEHAAAQLPDWVYESNDFSFDWTGRPKLTLEEFDAAYEKAWDAVFNSGNPGWRKDLPNSWNTKMSGLEADILQTMFGYVAHPKYLGAQKDSLPTWLIDGDFPISRDFVESLREVYELMGKDDQANESFLPESDLDRAAALDAYFTKAETPYISPFTGKPV